MSLAKAGGEIIVDASISDSEDDDEKLTLKMILNQTNRNPDSEKPLRWDDGTVDALVTDMDWEKILVCTKTPEKRINRKNKKTKRHNANTDSWMAPIFFLKDDTGSYVLCIKDVLVAACPGKIEHYGKTFVYVGLPGYIRRHLDLQLGRCDSDVDTGETPYVFNDARVLPTADDADIWWRTTRSVENLATTVATNEHGEVVRTSHSVADILEKTGKGFTITAYVKFTACAQTTVGYVPKDSTIQTILVDVLHGVLQTVNDKREGPVLAPEFYAGSLSTEEMDVPDIKRENDDKNND